MANTDAKTHYRYRVKDSQGKLINGRAAAESLGQVRKALTNRNYTILSVTEEKGFMQRFQFAKVSAKDRSIMYREMATMLKAGVSITQTIDVVSETPSKRLRQVLREISNSLENGFPLSVAMAGHPKVFPQVEVGMVRSGEATGNLSKVLAQLSDSTSRSAEFTSKVRNAMIYPVFIIVVMIVIGVVIMIKVIPPIKDIFLSTGATLPVTTRILLGMTDFLTKQWLVMLIVVIVLAAALRLFVLTKIGKHMWSAAVLNFPVLGTLFREVYLASFNRTLSLLVAAGVPIIEAVEIITESTANVVFQDALRVLIRSLEQGSAISTSLQGNRYFPKLMSQLLFVGQQSGDLAGTSGTLADFFEGEVDNKLKAFSALIEPFIIVVLGCAVAFVVLSVLQPIYSLTGQF
ncbi:MAG TPA: type II secretion system F family protein [Candidatus Saccharimonadales bacterium]|nr:type II secretion system F family protein [Candidatus Saccharimonadales bacterium]